MARGRKVLPEGEKMVHVSIRIPQAMLTELKKGNVSERIRKAVEAYWMGVM